jgi:hypothetical protein
MQFSANSQRDFKQPSHHHLYFYTDDSEGTWWMPGAALGRVAKRAKLVTFGKASVS